jgi:hypothetical protein
MDEFERFGERLDVAEVPAFELRVVKRVEVIERPDGVSIVQQPFANVRTNEASAAGDQKVHGRTLATGGRAVECVDMNQATRKPNRRLHSLSPQRSAGKRARDLECLASKNRLRRRDAEGAKSSLSSAEG